jgi:hypothetical protein
MKEKRVKISFFYFLIFISFVSKNLFASLIFTREFLKLNKSSVGDIKVVGKGIGIGFEGNLMN